MKKSTGLLAVVLLCSLPVFAQPDGGGQQRGGGQPSGGGGQQRGGGQPSGGGQQRGGGAVSVEVPPSGAATSRRMGRRPVLRVAQLRLLAPRIAVRDKPAGNKLKMRNRPKRGAEAARPGAKHSRGSQTSAVISRSSPATPMRRTLTQEPIAGWATIPGGMMPTTISTSPGRTDISPAPLARVLFTACTAGIETGSSLGASTLVWLPTTTTTSATGSGTLTISSFTTTPIIPAGI